MLEVVDADAHPTNAKKRHRIGELPLIIGRVDPKPLVMISSVSGRLQPHKCHIYREGKVTVNVFCPMQQARNCELV
jgi:hypothetical protein